jgi:hypothetical protein
MFLKIHDAMSIGEVEERFNDCFPLLKLELYSLSHKQNQGSGRRYQYDKDTLIAAARDKHYNGNYEIKSWYSTARVERELKELFDLNVQIFRRDADGNWVQTTHSDGLTLQEQSELALGIETGIERTENNSA